MIRVGTGSREESDLLAALLADSRRGTHLGESLNACTTKPPDQCDIKIDGTFLDRTGLSSIIRNLPTNVSHQPYVLSTLFGGAPVSVHCYFCRIRFPSPANNRCV